jgi:RNA polymerase sigma-70 factor (ECF subfamily)
VTSEHLTPASPPTRDIFVTTRWTVVLAAAGRSDAQARAALEELCRTYWFPLYAYVRRRGHARADAEDLTQEFFARFLEKNGVEGLNAERGRFRAFLLASLKHFLINEWKKTQRIKRGGQVEILSLDWKTADTQFQVAATTVPNPDQAFDREWAVALLAKVIDRLQKEYEAGGREKPFSELKNFLTAGTSGSYQQAALQLGLTEGAVRVIVHRLRKRYRALLRDEIAHTLSDPLQVDEELRALFGAFST